MDAKLFQSGLERLRPSKGAAAAAQRNGQQPSGRGPRAKQTENPVDVAFFHQVRQGEALVLVLPLRAAVGGGASPNRAAVSEPWMLLQTAGADVPGAPLIFLP